VANWASASEREYFGTPPSQGTHFLAVRSQAAWGDGIGMTLGDGNVATKWRDKKMLSFSQKHPLPPSASEKR
jgi:hypothetical protein